MEFRDSGFKDTKGVTIYFLIVIKMFDPSFFHPYPYYVRLEVQDS